MYLLVHFSKNVTKMMENQSEELAIAFCVYSVAHVYLHAYVLACVCVHACVFVCVHVWDHACIEY